MNRTQRTDLLHKFITVINDLPEGVDATDVMIIVKDTEGGTSFGRTGGWDDEALLTVICHIRSAMESRGDVDILLDGHDVELE